MCLLSASFYSDKYGAEYELVLEAWGEGVLSEKGLLEMQKPDTILNEFKKRYRRYPKNISLIVEDPHSCGYDFGFSAIEGAFLEKFLTLKELVLPPSVTDIGASPKLSKILSDNGTLIRGAFGSFAEKFAAERGLHFRPADFVFADYYFEPARESTELSLVFRRNGKVVIKERITAPGTSSSNTSGGSFTYPLEPDFCNKETAVSIAEKFRPCLRDAITSDGRLDAFIETAKAHDYYKGKN